MRQIIADAGAFARRPFVVESDEGANSIILQAGGHAVRIGPEEARRVAEAMLQAASVVEHAARVASGEVDDVDDLDDDLPMAV